MAYRQDNDRWDYDCPQFVDFTLPMPFNDGADQMFESAVVGEGQAAHFFNQVTDKQFTEDAEDTSKETAEKPTEEKMEEQNVDSKNKPRDYKPRNLVTSLEEWKSRGKHASSEPVEAPEGKKPRKSAEKALQNMQADAPKSALTRSKSVRIQKSSSASSLSTRKSAATTTAGEATSSRQARTRTFSQGRSRSRSNSVDHSTLAEPNCHDTTGGKSVKMPALLKSLGHAASSSNNKVKSSEQMEMERVKQLQKELQVKRQMAQESYKKAMAKAKLVAVYSTKCPTIPQEFHFQTDTRLKTQSEKVEEKSVGDFVKSLRSRTVRSPSGPSTSGQKKLTVPQPFHLTEKQSSGAQQAVANTKFQSLAEKVKAFHKQTPERFRIRAKSNDRQGGRSTSPLKLTQAHTPNLTAKRRQRPVHYLSQEQIEEQEIEEMKRNQFKARPVNAKVLSCSNLGVGKVPTKPLTQPEEFALSSGVPKKKKEDEEEHYEFHAKPVNKKILEGTVGVKQVKAASPTVPMSPAFALKHRVRLPEVSEEKNTSGSTVRAKAVPFMGVPFQPKLQHQYTIPEPFTVEERSKAMLMQKEEKIKRVLEEEKKAHEFHAQPLPNLEPGELPEKHPKELTKPEPFNLKTDQRGMQYLQEKVELAAEEEEQEELKKAAQFKAKPLTVIYKDPFIPAKSTKALTEVSDFELNSDRRAVQREEFEMQKKEREAELEGLRRQREQRQKEEEKVAIAKLRAEMVHRPNPVRHFNPVHIKPSDKPLTDAESPRFSDRLRAKVRL